MSPRALRSIRWLLGGALLLALAVLALGRTALSERGQEPANDESVWSSPEACERVVARGERAPRTAGQSARRAATANETARLRVATWNLRWFPDGGPGHRAALPDGDAGEDAGQSAAGGARKLAGSPANPDSPTATHLEWLACAIVWLDVDIVALQELKGSTRAREQLSRLARRLDGKTRGRHRVQTDSCPGKGRQHVGLLYDERRIVAAGLRQVDAVNPHGDGCAGQLRPALGGYFKKPGGADLHFLAVHFKSGPERRAYELRRRTVASIVQAYRDVQGVAADADVVVAGDFNTMGCLRCSPRIAAREEIATFDAELAKLAPPFRRVSTHPSCSQYYRGRPALLDHFVVSRSMKEAPVSPPVGRRPQTRPVSAEARVYGFCGTAGCQRLERRRMPRAYLELSDHCPVVLELDGRDLD